MGSRAIKNRTGVKRKNRWVLPIAFVAIFAACIFAGVTGVSTLVNSWLEDLPEYENLDSYNSARKTEIYASDGTTLLAEFYLEDREPVQIEDICD